jgi:hypothetical protein
LSTAKEIDSITDSSKFERLMNSILRRSNPEYSSIIETGTNIEGKPIKSPVDAFGPILHSKNPKYALIEHTTTKKKDLERKWLNEKEGKEGDLIKAWKYALEIRKKIPNAEFILVLTTNKRLTISGDKSESLIIQLEKKAKEFEVKLDIWEQSRIVDYLDNEPYGHWFRKEYLGITAEILSKPLLAEICKRTLEDYSYMLSTNNDEFVDRDYDEMIEKSVLNAHFPLHLIVGESGVGKSTIAYKISERLLKKGTYILWIPAEIIQEATNIENSINSFILKLYPTIFPESINQVINEITNNEKIVLIVDDINNTDKPSTIVQKLLLWSKPIEGKKSNFSIICPIWPYIWSQIYCQNNKKWINTTYVGFFNEIEGQKVIQLITRKAGFHISSIKARDLAKKLGNDPFLIDLFSTIISSEEEQKLEMLTNNVLDIYLQKETERIQQHSNFSLLSQHYQSALNSLCSAMLYNKKFLPKLQEIEEWFINEPQIVNAVRELIRDNKLCKLENNRFLFKHDRLLNYLQVKALKELFHSNEETDTILSEPYYANVIGQAILNISNKSEIFLKLYDRNILSLFESIKYFETTSPQDEIVNLILTWVGNKRNLELESVLDSIYLSLIETDSEIVIDITDNMPKNSLTLLARLRNGCTLSGIEYCLLHKEFELSTNFPLRDLIIEQAKFSHCKKIREELVSLLVSTDLNDNQRIGALILTGYFQFGSCEEDIISCWNLSENKEHVLTAALWAGMNCFRQNVEFFFNQLITFWDALPDAGKQEHYPLKDRVASDLRLAFGYKTRLDKIVINFLISVCESKESLSKNIEHILSYINDPDAIQFIVKRHAEHGKYDQMFTDPWNTRVFDNARKLSKESRIKLRSLWEDSHNDKIKKAAFKLWLLNIEQSELDLLRQFPPDSPISYYAILKRAELGDFSVIPEYVRLLYSDPDLFHAAPNVWCKETMEVARSYLSSFKDTIPSDFTGGKENSYFFLQNLLLFIPEKDAEALLNEYWEHLKYSPKFIHAALYVGTPKCLKLADLAIKECPRSINLFNFVMTTFSCGFMGYRKNFTEKKINNLLPYLSLFEYDELYHLVSSCEHNGQLSWARNHLYELLSDKDKKLYLPTDEDLVNELKTESKEKYGFEYIEHFWVERFGERNDPKSNIFNIIRMLIESESTLNSLRISASCIKAKGNRSDIDILKSYIFLCDKEEVSKIIKDTEYFVYRKTLN